MVAQYQIKSLKYKPKLARINSDRECRKYMILASTSATELLPSHNAVYRYSDSFWEETEFLSLTKGHNEMFQYWKEKKIGASGLVFVQQVKR